MYNRNLFAQYTTEGIVQLQVAGYYNGDAMTSAYSGTRPIVHKGIDLDY